ncbi:MAG: hypothetical protein J0I10_09240 [Verrucomicrobia bacterium]|nr:hypothetical protein [Verrucomicrobiota bacterium]
MEYETSCSLAGANWRAEREGGTAWFALPSWQAADGSFLGAGVGASGGGELQKI